MSKVEITYRSDWPAFNLRMPDDLKALLKTQAQQNTRSLNSEIVQRLRASLSGYTR